MSDTPPKVPIEPARKASFSGVSLIWLLPILALVVALGVAWQSYNARGPLIEIEFENGAGIAVRQTELRFRDVTVGVVEEVHFAEGLEGVIASVRLDKDIAQYVDGGAQFWIVRPELSAQGVSGLDTVLTGVYIEGAWDGDIGAPAARFRGLSDAPLFRFGREGLQIALRTTGGGTLIDESPITFRGIEVGRVGKAQISPEGSFAIAEAIIYHPHSRLISAGTRFWDASGFTFSVGPGGAEIDFTSVASLVSGGLTFDTFVSSGAAISDGALFEVFPDQDAARDSLFNAPEADPLDVRVVFDENISGLAVGAPVELSGLNIGRVVAISGVVEEDFFGDARVRLNAQLAIQPTRLGLQGDATPEAALAFLGDRITEGLRARLASASLLAGGLKIELVEVAGARPFRWRVTEGAMPIIPTTQSRISDVSATAEGVLARINNLPIEELLNSVIGFLGSAQALVSSDEIRETPQELIGLLGDVRGLVTSEEVQELPVKLNMTLARFETLLADLERDQVTLRLAEAVNAAAQAAQGVSASVEGVPALIAQLEAVAASAAGLPLEDLTREVTALTASANALIGTEAARALPADLSAALAEMQAVLSELRAGGAVENINTTLGSVSEAADAVAISTQELPALVARIRAVLDQASSTIAGFDQGETLGRDAERALRDISEAADALAALARTIERNPGALIRGR